MIHICFKLKTVKLGGVVMLRNTGYMTNLYFFNIIFYKMIN